MIQFFQKIQIKQAKLCRILNFPRAAGTTPIFYNGVNVYLEQKSALYRNAPRWVHRIIGSDTMLNWAAKQVGKTRAEEVGDLTVSMLRGEEGNQARELEELIDWL